MGSYIENNTQLDLNWWSRIDGSKRVTVVPVNAVLNQYATKVGRSLTRLEVQAIASAWQTNPAAFMVHQRLSGDGSTNETQVNYILNSCDSAISISKTSPAGSSDFEKRFKEYSENAAAESVVKVEKDDYDEVNDNLKGLIKSNTGYFEKSTSVTIGTFNGSAPLEDVSKNVTIGTVNGASSFYIDPDAKDAAIDTHTEALLKNDAVINALDSNNDEALAKLVDSEYGSDYRKGITASEATAKLRAEYNNRTLTANREAIISIRNAVIDKSFGGNGSSGEEVNVDILNDYACFDTTILSSTGGSAHNIPMLYAIEYEQTLSSAITNIVNNINRGLSGLKGIFDEAKSLFGSDTPGSLAEASKKSTKEEDKGFFEKLTGGIQRRNLQAANITNSMTLLVPYINLYATRATKKKFAFPYLEDKAFPSMSGNWSNPGDQEKGSLLLNNVVTNLLNEFGDATQQLRGDIDNIKKAFSGDRNGNSQYVSEMAKSFKYDTNCPEVSVTFTLFNTVIKNGDRNIWKKHYEFLFLFIARNMPWKITPSAFLPPLLYDVIIPGQRRFPLAYVSSIDVQTKGIIRTLSMDRIAVYNTVGSNNASKIKVSVPEAWVVTVKFKSLVGDNANLLLSGMRDLQITVNTATEPAQTTIIATETGYYDNMSANTSSGMA